MWYNYKQMKSLIRIKVEFSTEKLEVFKFKQVSK